MRWENEKKNRKEKNGFFSIIINIISYNFLYQSV